MTDAPNQPPADDEPTQSLADITAAYMKTSARLVEEARRTMSELKQINTTHPKPQKTP